MIYCGGGGGYTYSKNSTNGLGVNTKCIPTLFLQRRLSWFCIYLVEKHSEPAVDDTYPTYMTEMTPQAHVGVGIGPGYNRIMMEYPQRYIPTWIRSNLVIRKD
jgi:hypothetical protein